MEKLDHELLLKVISDNHNLKKLYDEHLKLEQELSKLEKLAAFSTAAEVHHKQLKKQKLKGMDGIMSILNQYRRDFDMAVNS